MDWKSGRRSDNVVDVRGSGLGRAGGLGIGGIAIVLVLSLLTGQDPTQILSQMTSSGPTPEQGAAPPANDQTADFIRAILGETEDVWGQIFEAGGGHYQAPQLVMFSGSVASGCGGASAASGPFYCPSDHRVYLDASFFQEMSQHLGGGGDFADAYVIAHEVGHHVQALLGLSDKAAHARNGGVGAEGASVRLELQADCFAGVWANHAQAKLNWLESGDLEQALNTASAIGDDRLQRQSQGEVVPDSFTHGSSEQRVRWFRRGFDGGDLDRCDTFGASKL
jgi:predicted metalloprotease